MRLIKQTILSAIHQGILPGHCNFFSLSFWLRHSKDLIHCRSVAAASTKRDPCLSDRVFHTHMYTHKYAQTPLHTQTRSAEAGIIWYES